MNESNAQPSTEQARKAAAEVIAADPGMAELFEKHSAGVKLSQQDYGRLGAFKASLKRMFGKGDAPGEPNPARPGNAPAVAAVAPAEALDGSPPVIAPNPALCQRVTGALLKRAEAIARRKLLRAAREADPAADSKTLQRFDRAASLSDDDKNLMIELSPDVARELGLDPKRYCLAVFFGTFGMWCTDIWLAIDELKQEAREREKREAERAQNAAPQMTLEARTLMEKDKA